MNKLNVLPAMNKARIGAESLGSVHWCTGAQTSTATSTLFQCLHPCSYLSLVRELKADGIVPFSPLVSKYKPLPANTNTQQTTSNNNTAAATAVI